MTAQEIVNAVYNGLKAQNFVRSFSGGACMYLSKDGLKCAAGQLMSPLQAKFLDAFNALVKKPAKLKATIGHNNFVQLCDLGLIDNPDLVEHKVLIGELQLAHDQAWSAESVKENLRFAIARAGLEIPADK